ncbi:MAG TPA: DUF222 domain-containing protein [Pseudonocardiaceae bacterium]|nr:DUF222 domain-containing protein [Pseudonocardiaceae bacterium]
MTVRQLVPEGLAEIPPGPELARVLAGLEPSRLSGFDCVRVLKAQYRQANHERARMMALMAEVGLCHGVWPAGEELRRLPEPDQFAADEVRAALVLTRRAAEDQFWLAHDLVSRLPEVPAAMLAGALDEPRARVFSEWTLQLSAEQARAVCAALLPQAPGLTTGQLIEKIKKLAISVDPEWARRRYEDALAERKVVGRRNPDGSASLAGYNLPPERVAAACGHIDALAKAAKRAGDARPIDHIRAELFLGMTDGSYTGLDDDTIVALLLHSADRTTGTDREDDEGTGIGGCNEKGPDNEDPGGEDDGEPGGMGFREPDATGPAPAASGEAGPECGPTPAAPANPLSWAGLELRVRLSTLVGQDQYPAELAGWGPVHAESARELASTLGSGQWRFVITDQDGYPTHCGITRTRPVGIPARRATCQAIVELQVPADTLRAWASDPATVGGWADVVTELARHLDNGISHNGLSRTTSTRRAPGEVLRRYLETRDRTCVMIGCRVPAHHADADHTHDHACGGPTAGWNIGAACDHDHALKHEGGWRLEQPKPGYFRWISRLGHAYHRHPPKIIEPLPDPIPRDQPYDPVTIPPGGDWENDQIWEDPPPGPEPPPEPSGPDTAPDGDPPPF